MTNNISIKKLNDLNTKNKAMMIIRLIIVSAVLGIGSFVFIPVKIPFYTIIGFYYLISLIFIILYKIIIKISILKKISTINFLFDILIVTVVVHYTRSSSSTFAFFYIALITASGILLNAKTAVINAIICSLIFIGLIVVEALNIIPPIASAKYLYTDIWTLIYLTNIKISIFILVSLLIGNTLKKLEEKEEEVVSLQVFYSNILKSIDNGIISFDLFGKITYANQPIKYILDIIPNIMIGKSVSEIFEKHKPLLNLIIHSLAHEKLMIRNEEITIIKENNSSLPIAISISPLKNKSKEIIGKVLVIVNLTRIKAMEEIIRQKEKFSALGELSANIAHEIRNPLASISGSIEVLNENLKVDEKLQNLIKNILKESSRLNKIISNFLAFTKDQKLKLESINLISIIKEILEILQNREDIKNNIKIKFINKCFNNCYVNGEEDLLKQVFYNLITNSIDAISDKGNITIEIEHVKIKDIFYAKILFKDDGHGIKIKDKEKIFQPFFTTKKTGTGIGLAIVYKIIKQLNGEIEVESIINKGTVFTIYLPSAENKYMTDNI